MVASLPPQVKHVKTVLAPELLLLNQRRWEPKVHAASHCEGSGEHGTGGSVGMTYQNEAA